MGFRHVPIALVEIAVSMAVDVALPYRTDWREMSSVLDYCKGKGADRGALEARFGVGEALRETLNALEQLRLIERGDAGDVRLTVLGEKLAYAPDLPRRRARLLEVLLGYPPYRFPLERAVADAAEVLEAAWVEHIWQVDMRLGQPRNRVEEARTCFFRFADEAGLGTYRRGVRGQTTRLELAPDFAEQLAPFLRRETAAPARAERRDADAVSQRAQVSAPESAASRSGSGAESVMPRASAALLPPAVRLQAVGATESRPTAAAVEGLSIHVDMSDWELDKIEAFLRMIGYLVERES
jgi:Mn-dependent DtxR family transcriptional regulator